MLFSEKYFLSENSLLFFVYRNTPIKLVLPNLDGFFDRSQNALLQDILQLLFAVLLDAGYNSSRGVKTNN